MPRRGMPEDYHSRADECIWRQSERSGGHALVSVRRRCSRRAQQSRRAVNLGSRPHDVDKRMFWYNTILMFCVHGAGYQGEGSIGAYGRRKRNIPRNLVVIWLDFQRTTVTYCQRLSLYHKRPCLFTLTLPISAGNASNRTDPVLSSTFPPRLGKRTRAMVL